MKALHYAILLVMLAAFAAVLSQKAIAGSGETIPAPIGQFSVTIQGSLVLCYNAKTSDQESCTTSGAIPVALTELEVGMQTRDATGSGGTIPTVLTALPPGVMPPDILSEHIVNTLTDYDPATGTGDTSFISYVGGKCVGAKFDKTGATVASTGTNHLVVSQRGDRIDVVTTGLTNSTGSIGAFSLTNTALRQ